MRRKATHLLALVIPIGMLLLDRNALFALIPLMALAFLTDLLRVRTKAFASGVERIFGTLMRPAEKPPLGAPISLNGVTRALLTATVLTAVFPIRIAAAAFATFMICDATAALAGRRFGSMHWGSRSRTIEGTVAFVLAGVLVVAVLPGVVFWVGALSVAAAAAVEAVDEPLQDNLFAPTAAAAVMFGLERFALGREVHLLFGP